MQSERRFLIMAGISLNLAFGAFAEDLKDVKETRIDLGEEKGLLRLDFKSDIDKAADFAIVRPPEKDWGDGGTWAVVLHGHGSTGTQLFTREDIRRDWLPELKRRKLGIICPNIRGNSWMCPEAAEDLHALLDYTRRHFKAKRFILLGGSMGGTSCLIYSTLHPEDVSACVALCPATDLPGYLALCKKHPGGAQKEIAAAIEKAYKGDAALMERHSALKHADKLTMPLFVVHGSADPLIPVEQSRALEAKMDGVKSFKYLEIPGGHDAPLDKRHSLCAIEWVFKRLQN